MRGGGGIKKKRAKGIRRKSGNWGVEKSSPGEENSIFSERIFKFQFRNLKS